MCAMDKKHIFNYFGPELVCSFLQTKRIQFSVTCKLSNMVCCSNLGNTIVKAMHDIDDIDLGLNYGCH